MIEHLHTILQEGSYVLLAQLERGDVARGRAARQDRGIILCFKRTGIMKMQTAQAQVIQTHGGVVQAWIAYASELTMHSRTDQPARG
jgi:hypothetical protein